MATFSNEELAFYKTGLPTKIYGKTDKAKKPHHGRACSPSSAPRSLNKMRPENQFWEYFQEISGDLEGSADSSLSQLYLHLTKIDERLYLHTGRKDDGHWDLILSAEGYPDLMSQIEALVKAAPELSGWEYLACYDGDLLFGERNEDLYPDDINGDTLFQMARDGDRPWISREVDFSVVFPDELSSERFLMEFDLDGSSVEKSPYSGVDDFTIEITLTRNMWPTYSGISDFEEEIESVASKYGGRNDGWGCFQMKSREHDEGGKVSPATS